MVEDCIVYYKSDFVMVPAFSCSVVVLLLCLLFSLKLSSDVCLKRFLSEDFAAGVFGIIYLELPAPGTKCIKTVQ